METVAGKKVFDIKKRAYYFSLDVIRLTEKFPRTIVAEIVQKQLVRSATSIGANLVEGNYGSSKKDFQNFVRTALKSAHESLYWLQLAKDLKLTDITEIEKRIQENIEIRKILATISIRSKK